MSAARLCSLLLELGYDGGDTAALLDPDSFEWPFQYDVVCPMLDWMCSSLRPSNVLSTSELSQYEQFISEGKLLEGKDLDAAFDSISAFTSGRDNHDLILGVEEKLVDIREAKLAYKKEALELQKQLSSLQSQLDLLVGQASTLIRGRKARREATSTIKVHLNALDDQLSTRNLEMNAVLGKIVSSAQELAHYHSGTEEAIYLAYSNFSPYLIEDSDCTKKLDEWFIKQFEKGPFRLVAEEGKSKCSWVSLDDINNCLARGDSEKSRRVAELQRLRSIFATSERQWVEAQVENAKQQTILSMLKSQISSDESHVHRDMQSLRRKHSELTQELSNLYRKEQKFLCETIPSLCSELAQLQDTYILQGDYDLKVMRQEYFINRQKAFISHLVNQLSRHKILQIACQMERKDMHGAYSLLKVIESELGSYHSATNGRVNRCLSLIQAASEMQEQGAVDDRDTLLHGVRDLLSVYSTILPSYVSIPGIIQQISRLQSDLLEIQYDLENSLPEERKECINKLCILMQSLEKLLFTSSNNTEPLLTPRLLMRALEEMEKVNSQLSVSVEQVTEVHRQKAEFFKHHQHEVAKERQVFVDFFCNPERLRNQVRELKARKQE